MATTTELELGQHFSIHTAISWNNTNVQL